MGAVTIKVVRIDDDLALPAYAKAGDAGLDLRSATDADIAPGHRFAIPCGIKIAIPEGHAGLVVPRSGLAFNHGITIVNAPGLIDSGFRGEIKVVLLNTDDAETFHVSRGDRIAQLLIIEAPSVELIQVQELNETARGETGFGSSGS